MSDIRILILQSGTTNTITTADNILKSGELAYTYANGDSAGGDRLFIGAGGNDSANGFATEIHTIGGTDGAILQHVLLLLRAPYIALSATVGNPRHFFKWFAVN